MEYMTTVEAAEKWGISLRQAQRLLAANRINDAKKYGRMWMIPVNAGKPCDPRREEKSPEKPLCHVAPSLPAEPEFTLPPRAPSLPAEPKFTLPPRGPSLPAEPEFTLPPRGLLFRQSRNSPCPPGGLLFRQSRNSPCSLTWTKSLSWLRYLFQRTILTRFWIS